MPPSNPGGLNEEICSNIVAFFLQANGAPAGNRPLAVSPEVRIGSVADGQMPPDIKATLAKAANADQAIARAAPVLKGLTVSGQVRNYQPVTDEMLRHPDPADWLIVSGLELQPSRPNHPAER
jgi:hypothetical protein